MIFVLFSNNKKSILNKRHLMKEDAAKPLKERLKFSHYVLFWCDRELEKNNNDLFELISSGSSNKEKFIEIKKKLKYIHSKANFEKKEIALVEKALSKSS
tara:strand:+ start:523 stop:822 length:300 start_codon:yes stop_codon:yes gene_type:complete